MFNLFNEPLIEVGGGSTYHPATDAAIRSVPEEIPARTEKAGTGYHVFEKGDTV